MYQLFLSPLTATPAAQSGMSSVLFIVLIVAVFYFFIIRPQSKQQKKIKAFQDALQIGDEVVTSAGIHGTVKRIDQTNGTILINVSTGTDILFEKTAIMPR